MPIYIKHENGLYRPVIGCDYCGQSITDAKDGNYEWIDPAIAPTGEIYFTHKRCCLAFEEAHGGRAIWLAGELAVLPLMLKNNLGISDERQREAAEAVMMFQ